MQPRGHPLRRTRPRSDRGALPFPVASLTSVLLGVILVSTLAALLVGVHRGDAVHLQMLPIDPSSAMGSDAKSGGSAPNDTNKGDGPTIRDPSLAMESDAKSSGDAPTDGSKGDGPTIRSLADLTQDELHPKAGPSRHTIQPPADVLPVSLVTCKTTAGYIHILVHPSWAPLGANRFLQMVDAQYFSTKVALMRCIKGFLCQFGIAGDPSRNKPYGGKNNLQDDPNWLPEGPKFRHNELGVKRFGKGYMAYAGGGKNSRSNQLIVALKDNEGLGGGSPWEVPWGETVGKESFLTLDRIYTGYGDNGPSQGRLHREGSSEAVAKDFPKLDYVLGCEVIDSR